MYDVGGGGGDLRYDYAAMSAAARALESVAARVDAGGHGAPPPASGDAAALVAAIVGACADAAARVSAEALTLGGIVESCSAGMQHADAQQAVGILSAGSR